jgi:hypothetical protein
MAADAARRTGSGVMKSGSQPPRLMTSTPDAFSALARSETATVGEGLRLLTRAAGERGTA